MKNVLFATTALVGMGFAGSAFAEAHTGVSLSGSAEMGVTYLDDGTTDTAVFHNDIDVTFTLSGATDNGSLTFGATVDLDEAGDSDNVDYENSVFVSGDFGTLSMGDVDGAYDRALQDLYAGGLSDEADLASGASGLDGLNGANEILRYDYAFGDLTVSASLALSDQQPLNDTLQDFSTASDDIFGIGVEYGTDLGGTSITVGAGYQDGGTGNQAIGATLVAGFGDFEGMGSYQQVEIGGSTDDIIGVGAAYSTGALGMAIAYEMTDSDLVGGDGDVIQGYVTYDLTGGAELVAAVGIEQPDAGPDVTRAGFGIGLGF